VIIHSSRVRAVETASYIMERFPNVPTLELSEVIDADRALFDIIRASSFSDPIIVGHNPTISELASSLAGARIQFSTCSFAAFDVDNYPPIEATLSRFYR
jgi:phosphohistidine phosphatase SixA